MDRVQAAIRTFETEYGLFDLRYDGVPVWERIRFNVYQRLQPETADGPAETSPGDATGGEFEGLRLWARNLVRRNPFFADSTEVLFVGHPRRKLEPDGLWWDIYCDPLQQHCDIDSLHAETSYALRHRTPAKTSHLRYLDLIQYGGTIQRKLGFFEPEIPTQFRERLEDIERALEDRFETAVPFADIVKRELWNRRCRLWLYGRFLDKVSPRVAVVVVSYGKETFIEACHERDIPVVELQHGVIYPDHLGYAYPGERTKSLFPDYLLAWGSFWRNRVEFPIPEDRIIPVGYPYLDQHRQQYAEVEGADTILFLSQPNVGQTLSKFAIRVANHSDVEAEIIYKLHPDEWDGWEQEYPWLVKAQFDVAAEGGPPLYQLFGEAAVQVGVGSTAVYEGLAFGLRTFVFTDGDTTPLEPLLTEGVATGVDSAEELVTSLHEDTAKFDREAYFAPDAMTQACETLESIIETGTIVTH
jgi:hypothetical protein